jgi:hypothetical protein
VAGRAKRVEWRRSSALLIRANRVEWRRSWRQQQHLGSPSGWFEGPSRCPASRPGASKVSRPTSALMIAAGSNMARRTSISMGVPESGFKVTLIRTSPSSVFLASVAVIVLESSFFPWSEIVELFDCSCWETMAWFGFESGRLSFPGIVSERLIVIFMS